MDVWLKGRSEKVLLKLFMVYLGTKSLCSFADSFLRISSIIYFIFIPFLYVTSSDLIQDHPA